MSGPMNWPAPAWRLLRSSADRSCASRARKPRYEFDGRAAFRLYELAHAPQSKSANRARHAISAVGTFGGERRNAKPHPGRTRMGFAFVFMCLSQDQHSFPICGMTLLRIYRCVDCHSRNFLNKSSRRWLVIVAAVSVGAELVRNLAKSCFRRSWLAAWSRVFAASSSLAAPKRSQPGKFGGEIHFLPLRMARLDQELVEVLEQRLGEFRHAAIPVGVGRPVEHGKYCADRDRFDALAFSNHVRVIFMRQGRRQVILLQRGRIRHGYEPKLFRFRLEFGEGSGRLAGDQDGRGNLTAPAWPRTRRPAPY